MVHVHFPAMARRIYVEITIAGDIDRVWELTQSPALHQKWDLRFTDISYLPRPDLGKPQRFLYATRIGFGLDIRGQGSSVGTHDGPGGERTSALKFWSDDPKSLIREGSGFWKYVPAGTATRFFTGYDYHVRFGFLGRAFDRVIFRPLMGWATAWSFDRLRLWIEKGIDPAASMRNSVAHLIARTGVAVVWLYQGVVPKLVFKHADELSLLHAAGVPVSAARPVLITIGWGEVVVGLVLIFFWRTRWPLWFTLLSMPVAVLVVATSSSRFLTAPFNPVSMNLAMFLLAAVTLLISHDLPSARKCLRKPRGGE